MDAEPFDENAPDPAGRDIFDENSGRNGIITERRA